MVPRFGNNGKEIVFFIKYDKKPLWLINKCVVVNWISGCKTDEKKSFHFPKDKDVNEKWICLVNRKN